MPRRTSSSARTHARSRKISGSGFVVLCCVSGMAACECAAVPFWRKRTGERERAVPTRLRRSAFAHNVQASNHHHHLNHSPDLTRTHTHTREHCSNNFDKMRTVDDDATHTRRRDDGATTIAIARRAFRALSSACASLALYRETGGGGDW